MARDPKSGLTDKEQKVLDIYLADPAGSQGGAYSQVYKHLKNADTIYTVASRLFRSARARKYLDMRREQIAAKVEITQERIAEELAKIAFMDPRKLFDKLGRIKSIHEIPEELARALGTIEIETSSRGKAKIKKVRPIPKEKALELLGRYKQMFTDKLHVSGHLGFEQALDDLDDEDKKD